MPPFWQEDFLTAFCERGILSVVCQAMPTEDFEQLASRFRPVFDEVRQGAIARDHDRTLPYEAVALLRDSGFGSLRVPKEFGGSGTSLTTLFALLTELFETDSNLTQILRGHFGFVEIVPHHVDEKWSRRWLEAAGKGVLFCAGSYRAGRFKTRQLLNGRNRGGRRTGDKRDEILYHRSSLRRLDTCHGEPW